MITKLLATIAGLVFLGVAALGIAPDMLTGSESILDISMVQSVIHLIFGIFLLFGVWLAARPHIILQILALTYVALSVIGMDSVGQKVMELADGVDTARWVQVALALLLVTLGFMAGGAARQQRAKSTGDALEKAPVAAAAAASAAAPKEEQRPESAAIDKVSEPEPAVETEPFRVERRELSEASVKPLAQRFEKTPDTQPEAQDDGDKQRDTDDADEKADEEAIGGKADEDNDADKQPDVEDADEKADADTIVGKADADTDGDEPDAPESDKKEKKEKKRSLSFFKSTEPQTQS